MIVTRMVDGVATFTLSRPPVNAINDQWLTSFESKLDQLAKYKCAVLHLRSNQSVFCAGADLGEIGCRMSLADGADRIYAYVARIQRLEAALREIDEGAECPGYVNGEEIVPWFVQIARKALSTKDTE